MTAQLPLLVIAPVKVEPFLMFIFRLETLSTLIFPEILCLLRLSVTLPPFFPLLPHESAVAVRKVLLPLTNFTPLRLMVVVTFVTWNSA